MNDPFSIRLVDEELGTAPLLGPAVSPRTAPVGSPLGQLDQPLAPFAGTATPAPAAEWAPAEALQQSGPPAAPDEEDSLAWLWADDAGALSLEVTDQATLPAPDPWADTSDPLPPRAEAAPPEPSPATASPELLTESEPWLTLDEEVPPPPSPGAMPAPAEPAPAEPALEWMPAAAEHPDASAPVAHPASAAASASQSPPAVLQDVADRLERIARSLRDRHPAQLFDESGADPLQLLITGYALGFSEAMQREEARGKREE